MLRVAVQNAILIALIILILSYLIRNLKIERFPKEAPLALRHPPRDTVGSAEEQQRSQPAAPGTDQRAIELFQWAYSNDLTPSEKVQPPTPYVSNLPPRLPKDCNAHLDIDDYVAEKQEVGSAPKKQTMNNLVLADYPNESIMNGGQIFRGITGFDASESQFSEISQDIC